MPYAMSKAERESFLAGTHVAVISVAEQGRGPLTLPVWYRYAPGGEIRIVTGRNARKLALIRKAGRMSLCVQTEAPPYRYVSIEGPARVDERPDYELDIRQVALRYLGAELGEAYLQLTAEDNANAVAIVLKPERWLTVDYNKMAAGA
jgi:nitroimidazol reductase NimA-like FMN-containing flavoprotein (pyridoxamine 5'-phosphate oxidase superfamily)